MKHQRKLLCKLADALTYQQQNWPKGKVMTGSTGTSAIFQYYIRNDRQEQVVRQVQQGTPPPATTIQPPSPAHFHHLVSALVRNGLSCAHAPSTQVRTALERTRLQLPQLILVMPPVVVRFFKSQTRKLQHYSEQPLGIDIWDLLSWSWLLLLKPSPSASFQTDPLVVI